MTATAEVVVRLCERADCTNQLFRAPNESKPRFANRKYCSQACMGAARRTQSEKPRSRGLNATPNGSPPPFQPRIENGVWRPNAPGWPAVPGGTR